MEISRKYKRVDELTKTQLEEFIEQGLSATQIGKIVNLTRDRVRHLIDKNGLKTQHSCLVRQKAIRQRNKFNKRMCYMQRA